MKEIRGIDIDEVLFETVDQALQFHDNSINQKKVTKKDITDYHFYKVKDFDISKEDAVKWFADFLYSDDVHNILPVTGAKEILTILQKKGVNLVGITGRLQDYEGRTSQALQKHYANMLSKVIYLGAYADINADTVTKKTKSEICKEIGATVMVEDDLHYAQELADNGIKVYLLDKPRNQEYKNGIHPNIIKIDTRKDILEYEKGVE